ncbi:unnamed protein product, partial [Mesorhabditis belari]|uniref:G protein-coupled receptor n=1 Tax=Mesorhabditis belari TaxID=2138241 RepID=A0AAF3F0R4_9BILA
MSDPISPIVSHPLIISIASAIVLCDIPFLLLIFVNRHLRKQKELIIVGFVCIADTAHALGTLLAGVLRLWLFLNDRLCDYQLMGSATLVVAFDRFIAVTKPVHYRALDERFTFGVMGGALNVLLITLQHDEVLNVLRAKFKRTREGAKIASSVIPSTASRSSKGHGYVEGS